MCWCPTLYSMKGNCIIKVGNRSIKGCFFCIIGVNKRSTRWNYIIRGDCVIRVDDRTVKGDCVLRIRRVNILCKYLNPRG